MFTNVFDYLWRGAQKQTDLPHCSTHIRCIALHEFEICSRIDTECFAAHGQCTPIAELQRMHSPESKKFIYVCVQAGSVVGFVAYTFRNDSAHILILAVAESTRRCGVATRLVQAVLSEAEQRQLWQCHLEVRNDNDAACALYTRLGFEKQGEHADYYSDGCSASVLTRLLQTKGTRKAQSAQWWFHQALLPELMAGGLSDDEVAVVAASRWRILQRDCPEQLVIWESKAAEGR
jgi:ribosomal protein S18 acetylase RimI-like enzyme